MRVRRCVNHAPGDSSFGKTGPASTPDESNPTRRILAVFSPIDLAPRKEKLRSARRCMSVAINEIRLAVVLAKNAGHFWPRISRIARMKTRGIGKASRQAAKGKGRRGILPRSDWEPRNMTTTENTYHTEPNNLVWSPRPDERHGYFQDAASGRGKGSGARLREQVRR